MYSSMTEPEAVRESERLECELDQLQKTDTHADRQAEITALLKMLQARLAALHDRP
jgi:hypothetical protein